MLQPRSGEQRDDVVAKADRPTGRGGRLRGLRQRDGLRYDHQEAQREQRPARQPAERLPWVGRPESEVGKHRAARSISRVRTGPRRASLEDRETACVMLVKPISDRRPASSDRPRPQIETGRVDGEGLSTGGLVPAIRSAGLVGRDGLAAVAGESLLRTSLLMVWLTGRMLPSQLTNLTWPGCLLIQ